MPSTPPPPPQPPASPSSSPRSLLFFSHFNIFRSQTPFAGNDRVEAFGTGERIRQKKNTGNEKASSRGSPEVQFLPVSPFELLQRGRRHHVMELVLHHTHIRSKHKNWLQRHVRLRLPSRQKAYLLRRRKYNDFTCVFYFCKFLNRLPQKQRRKLCVFRTT